MGILNFKTMPRYVGNPAQYLISSVDEFNTFLQNNNGMCTCFTSVYSIKGNQALVDKIFFDFDHPTKLHNALYDCRKLVENAVAYPIFTGGKGFHAYIPLDPKWYPLDEAGRLLKRVQKYVKKLYNLKTSDEKVMGDARRLTRIPYTKHVNRFGFVSESYCTPLTPQMLLDNDMDEIIELSKHPKKIKWSEPLPRMNLTDIIKHLNIPKLEDLQPKVIQGTDYKYHSDAFVTQIIPKMCIHNSLLSGNPHWLARLDAVIWFKNLGWNTSRIIEFFSKLNSLDFDWNLTTYHVTHAYRAYNYLFSCDKIKKEGLCVQEKCPKYKSINRHSGTPESNRRVQEKA